MSEEIDSKGEEPVNDGYTGEISDVAASLDFEDQPTDFDDEYALSDVSPDMLKLLQKSGVCMLNLKEALRNNLLIYSGEGRAEK